VKERPILFNGETVRAILDGRKAQTRMMMKPQPIPFGEHSPFTQATLKEHVGKPWMPVGGVFQDAWLKPLGTIGDRLWVRETFRIYNSASECACYDECKCARMNGKPLYRASDPSPDDDKWTPSIHMPRWASRITLEITGVRVERLQDISASDVREEGIQVPRCACEVCSQQASICTADAGVYVEAFRDLWQSIYGNWDANPWVWVYEFRRVKL